MAQNNTDDGRHYHQHHHRFNNMTILLLWQYLLMKRSDDVVNEDIDKKAFDFFLALFQRFSTVTVLRPLDDFLKVAATPSNRIDWVTLKESIFRGLFPSPYFC